MHISVRRIVKHYISGMLQCVISNKNKCGVNYEKSKLKTNNGIDTQHLNPRFT